MNKYEPLKNWMNEKKEKELILSIHEIEDILGFILPNSYYVHPAVWYGRASKSPHRAKKMWEAAGYTVKKCDLKSHMITFRRLEIYELECDELEKSSRTKKDNHSEKVLVSSQKISNEEIEKVHNQVLNSRNYGKELKIIHDVFNKFPENNDLNIIAMKIGIIDVTNSTNISRHKSKISLYDLAEIILNIHDFDNRVKNGDPRLVNEIAKESKDKYDVNLFSFASKYCCYHNMEVYGNDDYSIYDSIVKDNLHFYISGLKTKTVAGFKDNFSYEEFLKMINFIIENNQLSVPFKRRKLDHYIWFKGKNKDNK